MLESEKLAIAAHLHVALRRKVGRVIDVEWVVRNAEYAREVIRVAMADPQHPDIQALGQRLQAALFGVAQPSRPAAPVPVPAPPPVAAPVPRYVGRLR